MRRRFASGSMVASVLLAVLMVFVLSAGSAGAHPAAASAPQPIWAYGVVKVASVGPLHAQMGWIYQGNATIGYSVILNQTNTSDNQYELSVHRTMGVRFSVEYCLDSCPSATSYATLNFSAWETVDSFANVTTAGSVLIGNASSPALALENDSSRLSANVTEVVHSYLPVNGVNVLRERYLSASVASQATVNFSTPLGLFPLPLAATNPLNWSSAADFSANGSTQLEYYYHAESPTGSITVGPVSSHASVQPSGQVLVAGSYDPGRTITFGGVTFPAIQLVVSGPFTVREGFLLVPAGADIFGTSAKPWDSNASGETTATMASLDARASEDGHVGIVASSWVVNADSANVAQVAPAGGSGFAALGIAGSSMYPVSSTTVQGTPTSVGQATIDQTCLTAGTGCPNLPGVPAKLLRPLIVLGIAAVVVTAIVVSAVAVVAERRRVPPPVYPNANLYPPGAAGRTTVAPPRRAPEAPPPEPEEDPLGHLW